jgi:endonuclease/exonuclease/phosphatase family metal-dependent hydrolase
LNRRPEKPYHLDYVFASSDLVCLNSSALEIGTPSAWLEHSDHMPILANLTSRQPH